MKHLTYLTCTYMYLGLLPRLFFFFFRLAYTYLPRYISWTTVIQLCLDDRVGYHSVWKKQTSNFEFQKTLVLVIVAHLFFGTHDELLLIIPKVSIKLSLRSCAWKSPLEIDCGVHAHHPKSFLRYSRRSRH